MIRRRETLSANLLIFRHFLQTKSEHVVGGEEGKMRLYKSRGQHLLTNPRVLDSIVRVSDIKSDDTVLEIGPGTGNLTIKLLELANNVVAVEIDNRMVDSLRKRAAAAGVQERLNIINGDALKTEFPQFNLVVANIPYNISSPLLAKLVYGAATNPFRSATLLLQKEFAQRLLAKPGDSEYNRLAINMKLMAEVEFVMDVSKRDFVPCPKVDSSVVKLYPKAEIPDVNLEEWWAFTRTCFNNKNKTLGATFKQKRKLMELMKLCRVEGFCQDSDDLDGDDECETNEGSSQPRLEVGDGISSFKGRIVGILESGGYVDKRPAKLSHGDLLHLLSLFNDAGIFFHDQAKAIGRCSVVAEAGFDGLL
ncbi:ribosomal RNA small subunit methyltransferase, mitochondrial-like [Salvia miltiorrhiza]|uniref:ribosomal RNA small subunit methyltransferase, mitochondrial-like n=1 Tax=Salvia miltiorrhiza TaxID=226208 RepID=UPI0025ABC546|nr:ribosomal RNA small subunit methyltransferase, mitochondrial-like [Salvia miltiorrhiza]